MAQTFPMALADFFNGLPIQSFRSDLNEAMQIDETGAGEIVTADLGARLWQNDIIIRMGGYGEIERIKARLNLLRYPNRTLFIPAMPFMAPQYDPDGSILGASVVTLTNVAGNNRDIQLSGLPVGYELQPGDCLTYTYGSNPIRYAMHQVVTGSVANGSGVMSGLEVVSFIRPGFSLGATVTLIKPYYKAVVVPGSTDVADAGQQFANGIKFTVRQTLR